MERAQHPQRTCREPVWGDHLGYNCELADLHPGPHASFSVAASVETRDRWESQNPNWRENMQSGDPFV